MKSNALAILDDVHFFYPQQRKGIKGLFRIKRSLSQKSIISSGNLTLEKGDRLAILGNNGVGKTTLISLLNKKIRPSKGYVFTRGSVRTLYGDFSPLWNGLSLLDFTMSYLHLFNPHLSKKEVLSHSKNVMKYCNLSDNAHKIYEQLSFGQQSRVILAIMTETKCETLILDESFVGIDMDFTNKLYDRINSCLGNEGALILVSHNTDLVQKFCTKGYYLNTDGELVFKEKVSELVELYLN